MSCAISFSPLHIHTNRHLLCVRVCVCVCVWERVCECMCVHVCVRAHTCESICVSVCVCAYTNRCNAGNNFVWVLICRNKLSEKKKNLISLESVFQSVGLKRHTPEHPHSQHMHVCICTKTNTPLLTTPHTQNTEFSFFLKVYGNRYCIVHICYMIIKHIKKNLHGQEEMYIGTFF